jgi:hypothetical protein
MPISLKKKIKIERIFVFKFMSKNLNHLIGSLVSLIIFIKIFN